MFANLICVNNVKAQNTPRSGSNLSNHGLDKFSGSWISINNTDTIQLVLKRENITLPISVGVTADVLVGYYRYSKANVVIHDDLKRINDNYNGMHTPFLIGLNQQGYDINGSFMDFEKKKTFSVSLILDEASKTLKLRLINNEGLYVNVKEGISLPREMIFRKNK